MIEGLRYLPRVHAWRQQMIDKSDTPPSLANRQLDCAACVDEVPRPARARMNCGLLPAEERQPGGPFPECEVCPGYTMTLPEVQEATRALGWRKDGHLDLFYEQPLTPLAKDAIDLLAYSISEQDRETMRAMRQKS